MDKVYILMRRQGVRDIPITTFGSRDEADKIASSLTKELLREEHMREAIKLLVEEYKRDSYVHSPSAVLNAAVDEYIERLCKTFMIDYEAYITRKYDLPEGDYSVVESPFETVSK